MSERGTLRGDRCKGRKHLFREFDVSVSDHIDEKRVGLNEYYDLTEYAGGDLLPMPTGACEGDLIHSVYEKQYSEGLKLQNEAYTKQGHKERCKTIQQLETGDKTRPMEYIFQYGDMYKHISGDELKVVFERYIARVYQMCKDENIKCHFISAALHMDETTPHIHYKITFGADIQRGGQLPRQEECFRQSKIDLPNPGEKESRYNNRLMTFTEKCRNLEYEVLRELGYNVETKPRPNMRHKETREFYTQAAINREMEIRANVDRINAKLAAERSEIAEERSKLENEYNTHTAELTARERAISMRESLVKRIQDNNTITLNGKQYDILEILKGLEHYDDKEVGQYVDSFTEFFKSVAERGQEDLQQEYSSNIDDGWDWADDD